ncbi:MAG: hypothetical protein M3R38_02355 [Actinomycetota bacterium]|nr:hypothetical protein [Actinomycetota bacterium]
MTDSTREPEAAPTPRPWRVVLDRAMGELLIEGPEPADPDDYPDVVFASDLYHDDAHLVAWKLANARLIVEAVNAAASAEAS